MHVDLCRHRPWRMHPCGGRNLKQKCKIIFSQGSLHTSQISHLLLYPSLWLLVSGLSSQFCHYFLYNLLIRFCKLWEPLAHLPQECACAQCTQLRNAHQYHHVMCSCQISRDKTKVKNLLVCYDQWWVSCVVDAIANCIHSSHWKEAVAVSFVHWELVSKSLENTVKNPMTPCFQCTNEVCSRFRGNSQTHTDKMTTVTLQRMHWGVIIMQLTLYLGDDIIIANRLLYSVLHKNGIVDKI